ncbi:collagen alpha-1(VIII) chain-like [Lates calcarifer]|uniref:Collagen alpha-1(VIII) chain-like n=1 Tax=Lates calcarifer TaxID=8187 RepID=A0AAJ7PFW4_LATCA|nr:collagen alpha-1(VIII) chain-like [Lates calcarifer]
MKITVLLLLQLVCSAQSTAEADEEILAKQIALQQPCPQDVHAVLRELTASVAQQKVEMTFLQKENQAQAEKLEKQETEISKLKQQAEVKPVAFSASLYTGNHDITIGTFPQRTTLVFTNVVTNIGKAYNSNSGIFTAPVRGAYQFEWYIGLPGSASHPTGAVLVKNSEPTFLAYGHHSSLYGTSSNGITLLLEVGDTVFLQLWPNTKIFDNIFHHTTFSGHLLFTM